MQSIFTIEKLVERLDLVSPSDYRKVVKQLKLSPEEVRPLATWREQGYTRNCLHRTENYELILLCWDIGAETPIHGHGGEDCWVYQVAGNVEEIRYQEAGEALKVVNRMALTPGKLTYMHDRMGYHSLRNTSPERAMTLHIYASPIDSCKVFNDDLDQFEVKEMTYDTVADEAIADAWS